MTRLDEALEHRHNGEYEQAEAILHHLLNHDPDNAILNYHMAGICDTQGKEAEAVPYYERAISIGLSGTDLRGALLGLGSTFRTLGRYDDAVRTLEQGLATFPDAKEFSVFLAMAFYNKKHHHEAMSLLLRTLAETSNDAGIQRYQRAILFYHDKLDDIWD